MYAYGDLIEYIDGTLDFKYLDAKKWCEENNATLDEEIDKRQTKNGKIYRYYRINEIPLPSFDNPDIATLRNRAYTALVDPITCQISRLRDENMTTPELQQEIQELIEKRSNLVTEIKTKYPYSEENAEKLKENVEEVAQKTTIL